MATKPNKFLCVNGPREGEMLGWIEAIPQGYDTYNYSTPELDKNRPKTVFVYSGSGFPYKDDYNKEIETSDTPANEFIVIGIEKVKAKKKMKVKRKPKAQANKIEPETVLDTERVI